MDTRSIKEIAGAAAASTVLICLILASYRHGQRREISMLRNWAQENRLQLLAFRQRRFFEPAPFFFLTSHRTPAYLVKVRDEQGNERSAWVRLGTLWESIYWSGKHAVEVKWTETRPLL
jgi:hypothetical protein